MSIPPQILQPTLDLYNGSRDRLQRSGMAAAGFWVLAAGYLLLPLFTLWRLFFTMRHSGVSVGMFFGWATFGGTVALCGGAALIGFAGVGRGAINPWPRWSAVIGYILANMLAIVGPMLLSLTLRYFASRGGAGAAGIITFYRWDYFVLACAALLLTVAYGLALAYALQIAAWRRSAFMAIASSIALAPMMLWYIGDCGMSVVALVEISMDPTLHGLTSTFRTPEAIFAIFPFLSCMMVAYSAVLAVRVSKMRSRPLTVPTPPGFSP